MKMNICLASDNNYAPYMGTAIASILKNSSEDEKIIFHLIDGGITKENKEKIISLKNIKECEINFYTPDIKMYDGWFEKTSCKAHFSAAMFYRLSIASIIPSNIDKILYLDSDLIATGSLKELFLMDIENHYAIVIKHSTNEKNKWSIDGINDYFNSGVLLINNKLWIKNNIEDQFNKFYNNNYKTCFGDQDVLNNVLIGKVKYADMRYNVYAEKGYYNTENDIENPIIIHYLSPEKPWKENCRGTLFIDEFWRYYQYTPWFRDEPITAFQTILKQKFYDYDDVRLKGNWIKLFGIYSSDKVLQIVIFGIQINISIDYKKRRDLGRLIPIKKWRDRFREKFR
ncbi:glycosyltransferase family 8 protein [Brachyspira hyodysenteriae]|nr:glycosyltransferase family 8 protein [Brachyspira hyodysenteriae]MBT8729021.1 glycosyltransferase family 8 protein [Brachyspira hyodysenteriae]MBT8731620.1 glycosyltransferase family 8 protein [Brachyspira hyodysenteriae]MBT8734202.1 glycosyltransferase family 8 protein [Brachyspira hyodysenteriae]MBT8736766.1 glycosyltransferase family 8 protein [Brachyspira hyodysenteriae]